MGPHKNPASRLLGPCLASWEEAGRTQWQAPGHCPGEARGNGREPGETTIKLLQDY